MVRKIPNHSTLFLLPYIHIYEGYEKLVINRVLCTKLTNIPIP